MVTWLPLLPPCMGASGIHLRIYYMLVVCIILFWQRLFCAIYLHSGFPFFAQRYWWESIHVKQLVGINKRDQRVSHLHGCLLIIMSRKAQIKPLVVNGWLGCLGSISLGFWASCSWGAVKLKIHGSPWVNSELYHLNQEKRFCEVLVDQYYYWTK